MDPATIALSWPGRPIGTANAGSPQRERPGRRQFGRHEAGLRRGAVLVNEPTEYVVASNVAERKGSRAYRGDR